MKYRKQFLGLFLLLFGSSLPAQVPPTTALQLQVQWVNAAGDNMHWQDNNNCSCTLTVTQPGVTADTIIYKGTTDGGGNLNVNLPLNPVAFYTTSLYSNYYQMNIFTTFFSSALVTSVPVKSLQLHLRFTRPQINGVDQAAPMPAGATPPALTSNTQLAIGF